MRQNYAVIGNPIGHSLSPQIHAAFAKQFAINLVYERILGEQDTFEEQVISFFAQGGRGLNVTLPFKERAYALADKRTDLCKRAKAANTLWMQDGQLWADNTDGRGLLADLTRHEQLQASSVLILGAGGAARGIIPSLLVAFSGKITLANRTLERAQQLQGDFPEIDIQEFSKLDGSYDIILNATAASLDKTTLPLPNNLFANKPFCYDLAYNVQEDTPFLTLAKAQSCTAADGLGMLVEQAAEAFLIWQGVRPETEVVLELLRPACSQRPNQGFLLEGKP